MKLFKDILKSEDILDSHGDTSIRVTSLSFDSRKVVQGSVFFVIKGNAQDGSVYIDDALSKGAAALVYEGEEIPTDKIPCVRVENVRKALAHSAQIFFDSPSKKLKLVGVTGTNGKTTTATLLYQLFKSFGYKVALISTVENKIDDEVFHTDHTTPDPITLASFLNDAVLKGCTHAFMECSSHAIDQGRIEGLHFAGGIFTNLTHDHLDYHKTLEEYAKAKKRFFDMLPENSFAVANMDDTYAKFMLESTKAKKLFFSLKKDVFAKGKVIDNSLRGLTIEMNGVTLKSKLIGLFNAYNILGIYCSAILLGEPIDKVLPALSELTPPAGRLEFIESKNEVFAVVDYAHTPDALENVLKTLRYIVSKNSKIITVVGCGGDRDKTKRPIMGRIASSLSGFVIFTSDNPRTEDPEQILKDIVFGLDGENFEIVVDRKEAIQKACLKAEPGDIILVAGKGHETYQIFKNETVHFSDLEELQEQLQ